MVRSVGVETWRSARRGARPVTLRQAALVLGALAACGDSPDVDGSAETTGSTGLVTTISPLDTSTTSGASTTTRGDGGLLDESSTGHSTGPDEDDPWACGPSLGARRFADGALEFRVDAPNATHIEVAVFAEPFGQPEALRLPMGMGDAGFVLNLDAATLLEAGFGPQAEVYYGLRVWGPNWPYDEAWSPGSELGRLADVDDLGNRMNPNKLVLDPYALEVSHDPRHAEHTDGSVYRTDENNRAVDSGAFAPKGIIVPCASAGPGPTRPFRDEVVYEVHLRGLTMSDPAVPSRLRGTYAGAAYKAAELAALGVTAVEFLPLHETPNDHNELTRDAAGDNYWGYSTSSFFAPDRRYAADRSPGGPTRELRAMIERFHAEGIKVYADVVYNHTSEGGASGSAATILSWRGLDNAHFYELADDPASYVNSNGVGPNVNAADPLAADLILASLRYGHDALGFDGYRFDLASVMANGCTVGCYTYDATLPERIADELARDADGGAGVDLIAEAWGTAPGTYQVGNFPAGWAEWNDRYRDAIRRDLNRLEVEALPLRELIRRVSGSPDLFEDDGRPPAASLNFVVAHDGLTLNDLFRFEGKDNDQPWPWGPSDGGSDANLASSHAGDAAAQATVTRTATALLALSAGVPMLTGGDESGRTLQANNNPFNLDNEANWLSWPGAPGYDTSLAEFTAAMLAFRAAHAALRPDHGWRVFGDADGDGITEVRWLRDDGSFVDDAYIDSDTNHFVAWQLDGDELGDTSPSLYVAYNGWSGEVTATPPAAPKGTQWRRAIDTSPWGSAFGHVQTDGPVVEGTYVVRPRSLVVLLAAP